MDYVEVPPPPELRHLAKAAWRLTIGGDSSLEVAHVATPDGCMEIIRRLRGRSSWDGEQPAQFVAGLSTRAAELSLSGKSSFVGLRLWPWTWNRIAIVSSDLLIDRWADLATAAPGFVMPDRPDAAFASIDLGLMGNDEIELVTRILESSSAGELVQRSGRSSRWLQRWFARNVGIPPRAFFRLLRFSSAFDQLPATSDSLAGHAVDHGFADQAHMSREFRSMSGTSAAKAKASATGPFL